MRLDNGFYDDDGLVQGSKEHLRTRRRIMIRTRRECSDFQISAIPPQIHMKLAMRATAILESVCFISHVLCIFNDLRQLLIGAFLSPRVVLRSIPIYPSALIDTVW